MLYNLDWLKEGEQFPPKEEILRLQKYNDNLLLFNGDIMPGFITKEEFTKARERINRVVGRYDEILSYPVDVNYYELTSVKTADFVCGEQPIISTDTEDKTKKINETLYDETVNFFNKLYTATVDISRYGDGLLRIYKKKNKNTIAFIDPRTWFKIVNKEDISNVLYHVIAWITEEKITNMKIKHTLNVHIHERGKYTSREYELPSSKAENFTFGNGQVLNKYKVFKIGKLLGESEVKTGLPDFAVIPLTGFSTSDDCYGRDDYNKIDPILAEVWARLGQIAIILDKHSQPDYHAPKTAFHRKEEEGSEWVLKTGGRAFVTDVGQTPPGYITWDGQLEANFRIIDNLMEHLYKISEMGAVFDAALSTSNIAIETMKAKFISALKKAERITNNITAPVKRAIALLCEVKTEDINIEWCDGLPNDEQREIANAAAKINARLSTPKIENMERFKKSEDRADDIEQKVAEYTADSAMGSFE